MKTFEDNDATNSKEKRASSNFSKVTSSDALVYENATRSKGKRRSSKVSEACRIKKFEDIAARKDEEEVSDNSSKSASLESLVVVPDAMKQKESWVDNNVSKVSSSGTLVDVDTTNPNFSSNASNYRRESQREKVPYTRSYGRATAADMGGSSAKKAHHGKRKKASRSNHTTTAESQSKFQQRTFPEAYRVMLRSPAEMLIVNENPRTRSKPKLNSGKYQLDAGDQSTSSNEY